MWWFVLALLVYKGEIMKIIVNRIKLQWVTENLNPLLEKLHSLKTNSYAISSSL